MMDMTAVTSDTLAARLAESCDRIERLEHHLLPLLELKDDVQPIVNEAFKNLIVELDELDGHFRAEDALTLLKRLLRDTRRLTGMLERLEQLDDLVMDLTPVVNEAAKAAITELGEMERQGLFRSLGALRTVAARFSDAFGPDEIDALGDQLIETLRIARRAASPRVLRMLDAAGEGLGSPPEAVPSTFGLLGMMRDPDTRRGMAVLLGACRRLGRAAAEEGPGEAPAAAR